MTMCKLLKADKSSRGYDIEAWENMDKDSARPKYEVTVSKDGFAYWVLPCAKTTWKKKFQETVESY